tara:strand:+ start:2978 stop:3529 length:552 start_codon:yes stop_codon:yes gene_type:complete
MDEKKKSGYDLISELSVLIVELDSIDSEDDDAIGEWFRELDDLLKQSSDKLLSYRQVISIAKNRQELFREERDRYAGRFRAQGRVVDKVKELARLMLERHKALTGDRKISLKDGTWAALATSKSWNFWDAETGIVDLDPDSLPDEYVRREVSKSALKAAADTGKKIDGVEYERVEKTYVRWQK